MEDNNEKKEFISKYDYDKVAEDFRSLGINYTIESVIYLKRKGLTFSTFLDYDDYNTIFFVASGLGGVELAGENSNENRAIKVIDSWLKQGYTLKMLWSLCYKQAEEVNGFFTTEDEVDFLMKTAEKIQSQVGKAVMYLTATGKMTN